MAANNIRARTFIRLVLGAGAFLLLLRLFTGSAIPGRGESNAFSSVSRVGDLLPCAQLPGAEDTVVVMKTGATEIKKKIPVHMATTFRCHPNRLIFSDFEEEFKGQRVIDALEYTNVDVQTHNPDFEIWRRMKKQGRAALRDKDLKPIGADLPDGLGKPGNPGWRLDKWKFLPMVNLTFHEFPDKNWYIFQEADTYMFWPTTLAWLNSLSPDDPHYLGAQMQIDDIVFAHGGPGFILSRESMRLATEAFNEQKKHWEWETQGHWAGDCMLGRVLAEAGSQLTWAWPIFQGSDAGSIHYDQESYYKRLWCYPSISYHHMAPEEIDGIFKFEQEWLEKHPDNHVIRHRDVYNEYIFPRIEAAGRRQFDWDNLSGDFSSDSASTETSFDDCRAKCEFTEDCVQFALNAAGKCVTSSLPKLGKKSKGTRSGWLIERVAKFAGTMESCKNELWIKPFPPKKSEEEEKKEKEEKEKEDEKAKKEGEKERKEGEKKEKEDKDKKEKEKAKEKSEKYKMGYTVPQRPTEDKDIKEAEAERKDADRKEAEGARKGDESLEAEAERKEAERKAAQWGWTDVGANKYNEVVAKGKKAAAEEEKKAAEGEREEAERKQEVKDRKEGARVVKDAMQVS